MKTSKIQLWRFFATLVIYFVVRLIAEILFPYGIYAYQGTNNLNVYFIYFANTLFLSIILIWLLNGINQNKLRLISTVIFVIYGLQALMITTELWFFNNIYAFTNQDIKTFLAKNIFVILIIVPVAVYIYRLYNKDVYPRKKITLSLRWIWLAMSYVLIYFIFGYIIIRLSEPANTFYWDKNEASSFIEYIKISYNSHEGILFFQGVRGLLWLIFISPVIYWYRGNETKKLLLLILLIAFLPTLQFFNPNPLSDYMVKLAYFFKISLSNIIYGGLIYILLIKPGKY